MKRAVSVGSIAMVLASSASVAGAATQPTGFVGRADKACAAAGKKILALPTPTATTVVADTRATYGIVTKLVVALKAIKAPAKQATAYAKFVASTHQEATILKELLTAFNANQVSKLTKLGDEAATVVKRSTSQAKALGLVSCSKPYSPSKMASVGKLTTGTPPTGSSHLTDAPMTTVLPTSTPPAPAPPALAVSTGATNGTPGSSGGSSVTTGNSSQSASQNSSNTQSGSQSVGAGGVFVG